MTLYDWALQRRRNWKEEGIKAGLREGMKMGGEKAFRAHIAAILADETLTSESKNRVIAIINATKPDLDA